MHSMHTVCIATLVRRYAYVGQIESDLVHVYGMHSYAYYYYYYYYY